MSFQNLQIPPSLLAELYRTSLVEPIAELLTKSALPLEQLKKNPQAFSFLGGNASKITIVISEEEQAFLVEEDLNWLQRMLQACKLTLGDVAIVNISKHLYTMDQIRKELSPKKLILLGPSPVQLQLPLNFPQFKLQEHDGCIYLYAPSTRALNQESNDGKLLKSKLWVSLQKLFEV